MAYKKITDADLQNVGVIGLADTPELSATEMQEKFEETARGVIIPHFNSLVDELNTDRAQMYVKTEVDAAINQSAQAVTADTDKKLAKKADADDVYTKTEVDSAITTSTQTVTAATDVKLAAKADKDTVYTKTETDNRIADRIIEAGAGDMVKNVYDTNGNGVVDNAERLGGNLPEYYATKTAVTSAQNTADNAMPKSGGIFTGWVEFAEQMAAVFKSGTGGLKIASADNNAFIQTVDRNNGWINNLLQIDTTTGAVVGGELMPKSGGTFTGDISFNAWGGVALNSTNGIAYRLVADEWGQLVIQKYEKGNWVADMLNFGGGAGNEIYQSGGALSSGWNFKNISVSNSDWSSIDSKTACIRMLRK